MMKEEIPHILVERRVDTFKYRNKLRLQCLFVMFSSATAVNIWRDKLELYMPLLFNYAPVFGTGFVVKDLQVNAVAAVFEAFHDQDVGGNADGVILGLEWRLEDRPKLAVVGNHNVLVVVVRVNREAAGVVCVQLTNMFYVHMQLIGLERWDGQQRWIV